MLCSNATIVQSWSGQEFFIHHSKYNKSELVISITSGSIFSTSQKDANDLHALIIGTRFGSTAADAISITTQLLKTYSYEV